MDEEELRKPCGPVKNYEEAKIIIGRLVGVLEELNSGYRSTHAIGLAAPQIGIHKQVAIVKVDDLITLINPEILYKGMLVVQDEGCLSFPGKTVRTQRYNSVTVNSSGRLLSLDGLEAIAVQHEIDHLNSTLFFDRKYK